MKDDSVIMMNKVIIILFIIFSVFVCAALGQGTPQSKKAPKALAEIDTTLWKYLSATDRSQGKITKDDSLQIIKDYVLPGAKD